NFYIISIEIVFFSLIQELYVPDSSFLLDRKAIIFIGLHNINIVITKPKTFLLKAITSYLI
ncbi:hypothetical protein ACQJ1U_11605, partial [Staphylococcus aureus]|uniref:hypothetical protein n=1 Tax=Staphylococcus aureus TaxID=1280 RepID=UPI003D35EDBC